MALLYIVVSLIMHLLDMDGHMDYCDRFAVD